MAGKRQRKTFLWQRFKCYTINEQCCCDMANVWNNKAVGRCTARYRRGFIFLPRVMKIICEVTEWKFKGPFCVSVCVCFTYYCNKTGWGTSHIPDNILFSNTHRFCIPPLSHMPFGSFWSDTFVFHTVFLKAKTNGVSNHHQKFECAWVRKGWKQKLAHTSPLVKLRMKKRNLL